MQSDHSNFRTQALQTRDCPTCGEPISHVAKKCIFCGEVVGFKWFGFRGKSAWDVMSLLIIPVVLAAGGFLFNAAESERQRIQAEAQAERQREIEADRMRERTMQAYIDKMTDLLLTGNLSDAAKRSPGVESIARSKTITTLAQLDSERKRQLLQLLLESKLLTGEKPVVSLRNADLRLANLKGAKLDGVDLFQASLNGANLTGSALRTSNLRQADLSTHENGKRTHLRHADLRGAFLRGANLRGVLLDKANLRGADLYEIDLRGASLKGTDLTKTVMLGAQFDKEQFADSILCDTVMPNGKKQMRDCASQPGVAVIAKSTEQSVVAPAADRTRSQESVQVGPQADPLAKPILSLSQIAGNYSVKGTNPGTKASVYTGSVVLKIGNDGDNLLVHWNIQGDVWEGNGQLTKEGLFYIIYTGKFPGDGIFSLKPDGALHGTWRSAGSTETGTEIWTRR